MKKSTLLAMFFTFTLAGSQSALADPTVSSCQAQIGDIIDNLGVVTIDSAKADWTVERMQLKLYEASRKLDEAKFGDSLQKLDDVLVKVESLLYARKPKISYEDADLLIYGIEGGDAGLSDAMDCVCGLDPNLSCTL